MLARGGDAETCPRLFGIRAERSPLPEPTSKGPFVGSIPAPGGASRETCRIEAFNDRSLNQAVARFTANTLSGRGDGAMSGPQLGVTALLAARRSTNCFAPGWGSHARCLG
jgi:hypothetical protein